MNENEFGAFVREARKSRNLKQAELANKAGMHPTYISKIESDNSPPAIYRERVESILNALEITDPSERFKALLKAGCATESDVIEAVQQIDTGDTQDAHQTSSPSDMMISIFASGGFGFPEIGEEDEEENPNQELVDKLQSILSKNSVTDDHISLIQTMLEWLESQVNKN